MGSCEDHAREGAPPQLRRRDRRSGRRRAAGGHRGRRASAGPPSSPSSTPPAPTPAPPRAACAPRWPTSKRTRGSGTPSTRSRARDYLVDQPAIEIMCREAIDAVIELEHFGLPFNRTPEGKIDQRRFGGHTRNHGEAPVRRACYSADRTGHMILQTLFQQCVKRDVTFFNEFQVLDIAFAEDDGPAGRRVAGVVAYELATGDLHVFTTKAVPLRHRRLRARCSRSPRTPHSLTGDGPGAALPPGHPDAGHGVLPVPPHRASTSSASCCPRRPGARAASCATPTASASWSATPRR